jgi:phage internal scaffolding protein
MASLIVTKDAKYGDFSIVPSHQEAMSLVMAAEDHFMQLPSNIRSRFNNDPGQLLNFLGEASNREEAIKLGLIEPDQKSNSNLENLKSPPKAEQSSAEGTSSP